MFESMKLEIRQEHGAIVILDEEGNRIAKMYRTSGQNALNYNFDLEIAKEIVKRFNERQSPPSTSKG